MLTSTLYVDTDHIDIVNIQHVDCFFQMNAFHADGVSRYARPIEKEVPERRFLGSVDLLRKIMTTVLLTAAAVVLAAFAISAWRP
jgi:hypothetical protein